MLPPISPEFIRPTSPNADLLYSSDVRGKRHLCLSGPRSCGKTTAIWLHALYLCVGLPKFHVLIAREHFEGISESLLNSLEKHILRYELTDLRNPFHFSGGRHRPIAIDFPNGSRISFMGLRESKKIRGREPSLLWLNEATLITDPDVLQLASGSMVAGRSGAWVVNDKPFSQIILDTNPDAPTHWVYKHFHEGEPAPHKEWLEYDLHDNPAYSADGEELNATGQQAYEELLADHPPGVLRDRYVFGKWVSAEGAVFTNFNFERDVITELPDMRGYQWQHHRAIDFGYDDPFVCLWTSLNKDNGMLIAHTEYSRTHEDIEHHADRINYYSDTHTYATIKNESDARFSKFEPDRMFEWTVADHDPADCAMLRKYGIQTTPAWKDIRGGIHLMQKRINQGNLKVYKYLNMEKDERLLKKKKAQDLLDEIGAYTYKPEKTGTPADDLPDKKCCDHRIDALRYTVAKLDRSGPQVMDVVL